MSINRLTGIQLVVAFCFRIPEVLFNNLTIIGFICDSSVDRNDSWIEDLRTDRTNICFYHYGSWVEGWNPVKLA